MPQIYFSKRELELISGALSVEMEDPPEECTEEETEELRRLCVKIQIVRHRLSRAQKRLE